MANNDFVRFVKVYEQRLLKTGLAADICVDRVTGVNYLFISNSSNDGGGLTPLLDANGKPIVTPVEDL